MFLRHVPAKYKDEAPIVVTDDKGVDQWMYQGRPQGVSGLNAVVSWPAEEWGRDPAGFAEMRPGVYDVHERVRDMNRNGILASMCFPTFTGFSARHLNMHREDVTLVMVSAYNDWHIDEWAGSYPGRFIPIAVLPTWTSRGHVRRDPPGRRQGLPRGHHAGTAAPGRPSELSRRRLLGSRVLDAVRGERGDVPAHRHRLRGDQHGAQRADRQHDHPGHPGLGDVRAGSAVGPGDAQIPRPEVRLLRGRHRLDPVLPGSQRPALHQPEVAAPRLRRQAAQRRVPRTLPGLLRHRQDVAEAAPRDRHRHHRLGMRLPPLRLLLARRPRAGAGRTERRRRRRQRHQQDHLARTPATSSAGIRSPARRASRPTSVRYGPKGADVDVSIRPRKEWARLLRAEADSAAT